jgi:hypothetical protein
MKNKIILLVSLCFMLMLIVQYGCKSSTDKISTETMKTEITKEKAITIALDKAEDLGYSPEGMTTKVTENHDAYIIYFAPKTMVLGGDLTIKVSSKTGEILNITRGK